MGHHEIWRGVSSSRDCVLNKTCPYQKRECAKHSKCETGGRKGLQPLPPEQTFKELSFNDFYIFHLRKPDFRLEIVAKTSKNRLKPQLPSDPSLKNLP